MQATPDPLPAFLPIQLSAINALLLLLLLHLHLLTSFSPLLLLQAAARHATNSQMRQAGMADRLTRHTEVEEEEEEEFVAQEAPVQGHQNRRKKSDGEIEAERWCHDAFDKLWGLEVGFTPFHNWALFFMLLLAALADLAACLTATLLHALIES